MFLCKKAAPPGSGRLRFERTAVNNLRNLFLWVVLAGLLVFLFNVVQSNTGHTQVVQLNYTDLTSQVNQGNIKSVTVKPMGQGAVITGEERNGKQFTTNVPGNDPQLDQ